MNTLENKNLSEKDTKIEEMVERDNHEVNENLNIPISITANVVANRVNYQGALFIRKISLFAFIVFLAIALVIVLSSSGFFKLLALVPLLVGFAIFYGLFIKFAGRIIKYRNAALDNQFSVITDKILELNQVEEAKSNSDKQRTKYEMICEKTGKHAVSKNDFSKMTVGDVVYIVDMKDKSLNGFVFRYYHSSAYAIN